MRAHRSSILLALLSLTLLATASAWATVPVAPSPSELPEPEPAAAEVADVEPTSELETQAVCETRPELGEETDKIAMSETACRINCLEQRADCISNANGNAYVLSLCNNGFQDCVAGCGAPVY